MRRQDIHLRLPLNKGGDHVLSSPLRIPRELTRRYAIRWRNLKWPQVEEFGWPPGGKEGRLTVIAPLANVPRHVREIQPVSSWHGSSSFSCVSCPPQCMRHGKVTLRAPAQTGE